MQTSRELDAQTMNLEIINSMQRFMPFCLFGIISPPVITTAVLHPHASMTSLNAYPKCPPTLYPLIKATAAVYINPYKYEYMCVSTGTKMLNPFLLSALML